MSAPEAALARLLEVMKQLRDPVTGCPWDQAQDFASIAPHTIEEAYEVGDAIARGDLVALCGELGDLLFQVVYHARLAEEVGAFDFARVAAGITAKLERRHPRIFGDGQVPAGLAQPGWEELKAAERDPSASVLDDLPIALPALVRARRIGTRVARVGFDWPDAEGAFAKVREELLELDRERRAGAPPASQREELGDLLFAICNVARKLELDPEAALREANAKFERRFRRVEAKLASRGSSPADSDLNEMDALWEEVKAEDRVARAHQTQPGPG